jgi:hypothetical protein
MMQRILKLLVRTVAVAATLLLMIVAVIWPWPAPEVDWRTPYDQALAKSDCHTAAKIVTVAASAGAPGAMDSLRGFEGNDRCRETPLGDTTDLAFLSTYRHATSTDAEVYGLADNNIGFFRGHYVSAVVYLCAAPYNGLRRTDGARLSTVLPTSDGPIMAFHRLRRDTCLGVLENLAEQLVDATEAPAKQVADRFLTMPPLQKTARAGFLYARLVLVQAFVANWMLDSTASDKNGLINHIRNFAWLRLRNAAKDRHMPAIRLTISLLHLGRFHPRDDKEAYFWILRLRRLGGIGGAVASKVEANLSETDRNAVRRHEELDWSGSVVFH